MTSLRERQPWRPVRLAAAAALAGALAGAPAVLTAAGAAQAAPESAGTVSFTGSCGVLGTGLGASSTPDAGQVSVPAGSELTFANRIDRPATLRLDGETVSEVGPGGTAGVVFTDGFSGTVTATMQISCPLGSPTGAVAIEVVPGSEPAAADPVPTRRPAPTSPSRRSEPDRRTSSPPAGADPWAPVPPPGQPAAPPPGAPRTPGAAPASPADAATDDPQEAGAVPGSDPTGGGWPLDRATVGGQPVDDELAAGVSRTAGSVPGGGPVGLLALVATVCVVGVSAGAVRAIIAQRAYRASTA